MKGTAMSRAKYNLSVERHRMLNDLQHIQENRTIVSMLNELPDEWHTVGIDVVTRPPKAKVTLYLDKAVIQFFRAMGHGYQDRINRLLATYMRMCLMNYIDADQALEERYKESADILEKFLDEQDAAKKAAQADPP